MTKQPTLTQAGQGLAEYALILVLVGIVVIAILMILGPVVGDVFSNVVAQLEGSGAITSVSAERTGFGSGNDVVVTITVSTNTSVNVTDSQSASPKTAQCNGSCVVTFYGVGPNAGTVTVTAKTGGMVIASYQAKTS